MSDQISVNGLLDNMKYCDVHKHVYISDQCVFCVNKEGK